MDPRPLDNIAPVARGGLRAAWKGWPGGAARVLFAVLPLFWLSQKIAWRHVFANAAQVGAKGLFLSLLAAFGSVCVGALRWGVMLRAYGADRAKLPSYFTLLRHNMVGQYFAVLPTGVAGEAVRGYRVAHCLPNAATSYVILFVERIAGLVGLLSIAAVAAVASPVLRGGPVGYALNVGVALALGLGGVAFVLPQLSGRLPRLRAMIEAVPFVGPVLAKIPAARELRGPLVAVALSVVTQAFVVLSVAALLAPLSPAATLGVCARVVPAVILVTYIPLTPGGIGQREAAFAEFFALVGVHREAAVAASLLFFAVMLAIAAGGGLVLLWERGRARDAERGGA